ncbi:hypothetical protein V6M85_06745 [Sulfolobus tengchongensis]|uniref:Uncharacterized protein n=1 Tax=Sulfolobus tengchongensis TaxID=207809 RepID=A0AAX4KWD0_9CREN
MQTYFASLAVDQNYNELNFYKQIAIALLNLDLERREKIEKASIIGWPILLKKTDQGFLVLDETLTITSKIVKYIYPPFKDIASEFSTINDTQTFISKVKKINLDHISSAEISLVGLLNIEMEKVIKTARKKEEISYPILDSKISEHDVKVINENLVNLKSEILTTLTSLEVLLKEVEDTRIRIKRNLSDQIEEINKKYKELIENKTKEIENEIQNASNDISNSINNEVNSKVSKLTETLTRQAITSLKYEGGTIGKTEFESSNKELETVIDEIRKIKDNVIEKYLEKVRYLKRDLDKLYADRNNEIEKINNMMREVDNVANDFRNRANKAKENMESFVKYIDLFYEKLDLADDTTVIIPFLIAKTNKGNVFVTTPQIYKGKAKGIFSKVFRKSELSEPLSNSLQVFVDQLKKIEINDNIKIYSAQINTALEEIKAEGWKSIDTLEDIYTSA